MTNECRDNRPGQKYRHAENRRNNNPSGKSVQPVMNSSAIEMKCCERNRYDDNRSRAAKSSFQIGLHITAEGRLLDKSSENAGDQHECDSGRKRECSESANES